MSAFGRHPHVAAPMFPTHERPLLGNIVEQLSSILIVFGADFGE
jgi:hypothetical protein